MLSKIVRFIIIEILYNGHLQALGAFGIVYLSYSLLFHQAASISALLLIYFLFQFIYLNDRSRGIGLDLKTNSARSLHLSKYIKYVPLLMTVYAFFVILISLIYYNFEIFIFCMFILLMGYLYPIYFKLLTKRIYLFKNIYVSSVFAILIFFPFIQKRIGITGSLVYYLLVYIFIETMIMQIILDCKDVLSDKKQGLLTLPVLLGKKNCQKFLMIFTSIFYVILLLTNYLVVNITLIKLITFSLAINVLTLHLLFRDKKSAYIISASKYFFWLLLLLIL